jgi:hypothetical protein
VLDIRERMSSKSSLPGLGTINMDSTLYSISERLDWLIFQNHPFLGQPIKLSSIELDLNPTTLLIAVTLRLHTPRLPRLAVHRVIQESQPIYDQLRRIMAC